MANQCLCTRYFDTGTAGLTLLRIGDSNVQTPLDTGTGGDNSGTAIPIYSHSIPRIQVQQIPAYSSIRSTTMFWTRCGYRHTPIPRIPGIQAPVIPILSEDTTSSPGGIQVPAIPMHSHSSSGPGGDTGIRNTGYHQFSGRYTQAWAIPIHSHSILRIRVTGGGTHFHDTGTGDSNAFALGYYHQFWTGGRYRRGRFQFTLDTHHFRGMPPLTCTRFQFILILDTTQVQAPEIPIHSHWTRFTGTNLPFTDTTSSGGVIPAYR